MELGIIFYKCGLFSGDNFSDQVLVHIDCVLIVRIEFSPMVEINVSKGHYFPKETTKEGPTRVHACTCVIR